MESRDYVGEMKSLLTDMLNHAYSLDKVEKKEFTKTVDSALDELEAFAKDLVQNGNGDGNDTKSE